MPRFVVGLQLGFERRPDPGEYAFLGELDARAQPWGIDDLLVTWDVEAPDMVEAFGRAKELVADRLGATLVSASVGFSGVGVRPGSWWQRWRHRRPGPTDRVADA